MSTFSATPHKLVIAEKPSVAQAIAAALGITEKKDGYIQGAGYIVSWCIGHLASLADAAAYDEKYAKWRYGDLPIIPDKWKLAIGADKAKQFKILSSLMRESRVSSLVCATDAGREGELIFRFVYEMAGCTKPFERLWISSMEDAAIREGFNQLKDGHAYDNLYASALCRAKADWLIGINATRLFTTLYHHKLVIGRVQSPTLAMLVDREAQIGGFRKTKYHHVHIACGGFDAVSERIADISDAQRMMAACQGSNAIISSVKQVQKTINPPLLYDLTTLQREANRLYGYTAQQTLDYAQSLYEKKLITYPRTDSRFLTEDMRTTATAITTYLMATPPFAQGDPFAPDIAHVLNNAKVSDHHAIIPTVQSTKTNIAAIPEAERAILLMLSTRLLCATAAKHIYDETTVVIQCSSYTFTTKGKTIIRLGWKAIEQTFLASHKSATAEDEADQDVQQSSAVLPALVEGQSFSGVTSTISDHTTAPPKPFTEDTLLSAMETAGNDEVELLEDSEKRGLGTPATRASIIEKLVSSGFARRKGKQLLPTQDGTNLITILPAHLRSPTMTAEWENTLTMITRGEMSSDAFLSGITAMTHDMVRQCNVVSDEHMALFGPHREPVGTCPRCGNSVIESERNFFCSNRSCHFVMWKDDRFFTSKKKMLTAQMAADLLSNGQVSMEGLYSEKTGKRYAATVVLADTGDKYVNYRLEFHH